MLKFRKKETNRLLAVMSCLLLVGIHIGHPVSHGGGHEIRSELSVAVPQVIQADHHGASSICKNGFFCLICAGFMTLHHVAVPEITLPGTSSATNIVAARVFQTQDTWCSALPRAPPFFS